MVTKPASKHDARLEAQLPKEVRAMLVRAAELQGRSLTDFVVASAHEAAMRTLEAHSVLQVSAQDQLRFFEAVSGDEAWADPSNARAALKRAKRRHGALIAPV